MNRDAHINLLNRAQRHGVILFRNISDDELSDFLTRVEINIASPIRASVPIISNTNPYNGQYTFRVILGNIINFESLGEHIENIRTLLQFMIDWVKICRLNSNGKLSLRITDEEGIRNVSTPLMDNLTPQVLFDLIEMLFQSDETLDLSQAVMVITWSNPRRIGSTPRMDLTRIQFVKRKQCLIYIESATDCFYQCLAIAMFPERGYHTRTHKLARIRQAAALRNGPDLPVTFGELDALEEKFNIAIFVINYFPLAFSRKSKREGLRLFLLYSEEAGEGHFDYIKEHQIHRLWKNMHNFCFICFKAYQSQRHKCMPQCEACRFNTCSGIGTARGDMSITCQKCFGRFFSDECMNNPCHRSNCGKQKIRCVTCNVLYRRKANHKCGELYCTNCKIFYNERNNHKCYMQVLTEESKDLPKPSEKYLYYDFESFLDDGVHTVAFAVVMYHESNEAFKFDSIKEFMAFLFNERHEGFTAIGIFSRIFFLIIST